MPSSLKGSLLVRLTIVDSVVHPQVGNMWISASDFEKRIMTPPLLNSMPLLLTSKATILILWGPLNRQSIKVDDRNLADPREQRSDWDGTKWDPMTVKNEFPAQSGTWQWFGTTAVTVGTGLYEIWSWLSEKSCMLLLTSTCTSQLSLKDGRKQRINEDDAQCPLTTWMSTLKAENLHESSGPGKKCLPTT